MTDALLVTSSFLPGRGGIESHLAELARRLAPRLAVMAPAVRGDERIPDDLGYATYGYPGSMLVPSRKVLEAIASAAGRERTRRILFGTPWPLGLLGPALAQRGFSYAVIVHGAETSVPGAVPILRHKIATGLAGAKLLLPVSDATARMVRALIDPTRRSLPRLELMPAWLDVARFSPRSDSVARRRLLGIDAADRMVLYLGRLVRRKGVHRLIKAYPAIAEHIGRVVLVVAGTGPEENRLRRLARRVGARVVFTGRVPRGDAPIIYSCADVFALPVADRWMGLEMEGLGVVLLEAAACAVPCVTGRSGGTPEAVVDGRTGFVVDALEQEELVTAIVRLLADKAMASAMGEQGRRRAVEVFGRPGVPDGLLDWLG
jgi:phosphatidyl-myo-inositol dimannoside synthase